MGKGKDIYAQAGVDIEAGDRLVDWLKNDQQSESHPYGQVLSGIGGFAGLFQPDLSKFAEPVLVAATDGVGTKVLLGLETGQVDGLGIDLVAMCANDLYTLGAVPLFFLDYYATGKLDDAQFKAVLQSIKEGVRQSRAVLLGGETAEMPGLYQGGEFDLAGFMVGMVDRTRILGPHRVKAGDRVYGLASNGFHSNGFSLVRRWLKEHPQAGEPIMKQIMAPTRIYGKLPEIAQQSEDSVHAMAHITGGGLSGNLCRVLPEGLVARIETNLLPRPEWMLNFAQACGGTFESLEAVFNWGTGMVLVVDDNKAQAFEKACAAVEYQPYRIGNIEKVQDQQEKVLYQQ